jgi:sugar phosphate isomerase/epimerase
MESQRTDQAFDCQRLRPGRRRAAARTVSNVSSTKWSVGGRERIRGVLDAEELWLWAGTLASASLAQRVEAAVAGGFKCLSLLPTDYRRARAEGLTDRDIRALHKSHGLRLKSLDPYARWLPRWEPRAVIGTPQDEFFAIAEALELDAMTAIEPFGTRYPAEQLAESFAALCDRAAKSGLRVHLEFAPYSGIRDLEVAWEVVRLADRRNGGIAFDVWHYFRGSRDDELLSRIPGDRLFVIQVSDAAAEPVGQLVEDTWTRRLLPGDGAFDLIGVLGIIARKEQAGPIGIEVLSEELWRLSPSEIGRRSGDALRRVLRETSSIDP